MQNLWLTAGIMIATIVVNVALAYSGTTQKLSCTLEQTAAAAAAIIDLPAKK